MAASVGSRISWLQSFDHLRAPALARPPDCSDRSACAGPPGLSHHASPSRLPEPGCGVASRPTWTTDVAGLARAGSWVMLTSLLKTLAGKHDSTVTKMARKYQATIETPHGPRKCIQVRVPRGDGKKPLVATFGGIPLRRQKNAILRDREPARANTRRKELVVMRLWFTGSSRDGASSADRRTRCACTKSASSPTSPSPDSRSPTGCKSWPSGGARPSSSAPPATPPSTKGGPPRQSRDSRRRAR